MAACESAPLHCIIHHSNDGYNGRAPAVATPLDLPHGTNELFTGARLQIDWASFTPWSAVAGGVLIGIAAALLLLVTGRTAGVSGVLGGLLRPAPGDVGWRIAFVLGLLVAPLVFIAASALPPLQIAAGYPMLIASGLLVGLGTRYGAGCTSGHGVCGVSRASPRSIVATLAFMLAGFVTVYLVRHVPGP